MKDEGGDSMRMNMGFQSGFASKERLLAIDFHDFIIKSLELQDTEIAQEFGVTLKEVESLKHKIKR